MSDNSQKTRTLSSDDFQEIVATLLDARSPSKLASTVAHYPFVLTIEFHDAVTNLAIHNRAIGDHQHDAMANRLKKLLAVLTELRDHPGLRLVTNSTKTEPLSAQLIEPLAQLSRPYHPDQSQKRIALAEEALTHLSETQDPVRWSGLHIILGSTHFDNPHGNRSKNIERAISAFEIAADALDRADSHKDKAKVQVDLAYAYYSRLAGDKAENIEKSISLYESALAILTPEDSARSWGLAQSNLALACVARPSGDRAENIERCICAASAALKIFTPDEFPSDWATANNNLGQGFYFRIKGDRAENIETAIAKYQEVITHLSNETSTELWGLVQSNLGLAYADRIEGDPLKNAQRAINAYQLALKAQERDPNPLHWARTQSNLGILYDTMGGGESAENIELAIQCYHRSLQVFDSEEYPVDWANTLNNLGISYRKRIRGNRTQNIEIAIDAFQAALGIRTIESSPYDWADTQNNLGNAYRLRILGDREENLELAISAYENALRVRTLTAQPIQWAMTQDNLGSAYASRIRGDASDNRKAAIRALTLALQVRTKEALPLEWASTQNNLGMIYCKQGANGDPQDVELAIRMFSDALQVSSRDAFPREWAAIQSNLGTAYYVRRNGDRTINRRIAEECWRSVLSLHLQEYHSSTEGSYKYDEITDSIDQLATLLSEDRRYAELIALIEDGKSIALREALRREDARPTSLSSHETALYRDAARQVRMLRSQYRQVLSTPTALAEQQQVRSDLATALQRLNEWEAKADSRTEASDFPRIRSIAERWDVTLVYLRATNDKGRGTECYIVDASSTSMLTPTFFPAATSHALRRLFIGEYADGPPSKERSEAHLDKCRSACVDDDFEFGWAFADDFFKASDNEDRERYKHILERETEKLLSFLSRNIGPPLSTALSNYGDTSQLVVIPDQYWSRLPLHAMEIGGSGASFGDRYVISYSPSALVYDRCRSRVSQPRDKKQTQLVSVANPDGTLVFSNMEAEKIETCATHSHTAYRAEATREWLFSHSASADLLNLSTHASFNPYDVERSHFLLAHPEGLLSPLDDGRTGPSWNVDCQRLELGEVWRGDLPLKPGCIVTANACETAQDKLFAADEEHQNFPTAFILAGASSVLATMWTVDDLAAAILMEHVYQNLLQEMSPSLALKSSVRTLRNVSRTELINYLRRELDDVNERITSLESKGDLYYHLLSRKKHIISRTRQYERDTTMDRPFDHPYLYAAFAAYGC